MAAVELRFIASLLTGAGTEEFARKMLALAKAGVTTQKVNRRRRVPQPYGFRVRILIFS
jgi:hypothetical protein